MSRRPLVIGPIIGSIRVPLKICRREIKQYGHDEAYRRFIVRSDHWIEDHRSGLASCREEAIAIAEFAAGLSIINVMFQTGEIDNGE